MPGTRLGTISLRDVSEGIMQKVDTSITPKNSVSFSVNFIFDDVIGRAVIRSGTVQLGSQLQDNKTCLGLYQYNSSGGLRIPLAAFNNSGDTATTIFKYTSSTWSSATTLATPSLKVRFLTYLDVVMATNGTDAVKGSTDGSTWVATGTDVDLGNFPKFKVFEEFKDKIYGAGVSGNLNRLYYSSAPTAGAISWTAGNGFIDIEPEEGAGNITALSKVPGYLLVFKERSMKRWDGQSTYPDSLMNVGTPSQEAVVKARQSVFFYNSKGIFETQGEFPRKISRRIQKIIEAVPASYYTSVSGWSDTDNVYFSLGPLTLDGIAWPNCVIRYNIDSQSWSFHSLGAEMRAWGEYIDSSGNIFTMAGDTDGNVWECFTGVTGDNGKDIKWLLQYQTQEFGSRGIVKNCGKVVTYVDSLRNGNFLVKTNIDTNYRPYQDTIKSDVQELTGSCSGNYFDVRVMGQGKSGSFIGIDFPELDATTSYGS